MSIASGYKKFKKYILTSSGFQLVSHWTKANTLEFDDGKTAQDKLGAIDGISSSRESNSDKIAASTALVSELNSDLGGFEFSIADDGTPMYKPGGADTALPFSSGNILGKTVCIVTYQNGGIVHYLKVEGDSITPASSGFTSSLFSSSYEWNHGITITPKTRSKYSYNYLVGSDYTVRNDSDGSFTTSNYGGSTVIFVISI